MSVVCNESSISREGSFVFSYCDIYYGFKQFEEDLGNSILSSICPIFTRPEILAIKVYIGVLASIDANIQTVV